MVRDTKIDTLRTLSNLMIVVWHAWAVYRFCPKIPAEFYFWKGVCGLMTVTMPAFFFVSGYLFAQGLNHDTIVEKISHRIKRLLVPYMIWNLIFVAFLVMLNDSRGFVAAFFGGRPFSWTSIYPLLFDFRAFPADTPLWFLRSLFIYSLLGMPLLFAMKWGRLSCSLVWAFCFAYMVIAEVSGLERGLEYSYPSYSMVAFLGGAWFMVKGKSPFDFFDRWPFAICGLAGILLMALYTIKFKNFIWLKNCAFVLELPTMFIVINKFNYWIQRCDSFSSMKNAAFFIYCSHWLVCPLLVAVIYPILSDNPDSLSAFIVIFVGAGVPVMVWLHSIMVRFLPGLTCVLNGSL